MMQTEAVFENISERIKQELWKAQKAIHIAVAWFTNKELFDILKIKAQNNCKVFIIINDDEINNNSSITYDSLNIKNIKIFKSGFAKNELMHNKFCIIDNTTIITGSYNWSYKAQSNFENIIITYNDNILANQFLDEFNKIVKIINPKEALKVDVFPLHIVVKRLEIIKNYILLDDNSSLVAESLKLSQYEFNDDISEIITLVNSDDFNLAIPIIDNFIRQNQQVELWIDKELAILKTEVRKLENQINAFDNEKTELEKIILEFQHRHTLELGDIILKILKLRKLKFKNSKDKFDEAEQDEKQYREQFDLENSKKFRELSDQEKSELKSKFRKATVLCHPDKVVNELKETAQKIFVELKSAYDQNDLIKVSEILKELEKGNLFRTTSETITEKDLLQVEITRLKSQIKIIENEIISIKLSDTYRKVIEISDWDHYFEETRHKLNNELDYLQKQLTDEAINIKNGW
jgi:hypothetical protein